MQTIFHMIYIYKSKINKYLQYKKEKKLKKKQKTNEVTNKQSNCNDNHKNIMQKWKNTICNNKIIIIKKS